MIWSKRGLIFQAASQRPWLRSHASNPVALRLSDGRYRVYFASRDDHNRSHVGWVELDLDHPDEQVIAEQPALSPGSLGHFDDHGVYASSIVETEGRLLLYYTGWNPSATSPVFYASIGLAESNDGGLTFNRVSRAPIMGRNEVDPWMTSQPFVLREEGLWRMWYISGLGWVGAPGADLWSHYHLHYAESNDGVHWIREGRVAIGLELPDNENVSRGCVLHDERWRMWYGFTHRRAYRIGYAESEDGRTWSRHDDRAGLPLSKSGWDAESQEYPWVFHHNGGLAMLYNGNAVGRDGFGLALEQ